MSATDNEWNPVLVVLPIGDQGRSQLLSGCNIPKKSRLMKALLMDAVGIPADNTDYVVIQLKLGSTVIGSYDSRAAHEGALTALVSGALTLVTAQQELAKGVDLSINVAVNGAALLTNANLALSLVQW